MKHRHNFFGKKPHRAQRFFLRQTPRGDVEHKLLRLERVNIKFDLLDTVVRRAPHGHNIRSFFSNGVAGFLLPGNYVDVVSSRRVQEHALAETIVQKIKVLAVDQTTSTDKNDPIIVRAVTLEVTPAQAEKIAKAAQEGKIQLTLRNPTDERVNEEPPPVEVKVAAARPRPQAAPVITIVRGTEVSTTPGQR